MRNVSKIAISGSVSVAKTTVVNCLRHTFEVLNPLDRALADPGPVVEFVTEAAREVFEKFPKLDRDSYEADWRIANKIFANEARVLSETDAQVLVCDRSVLDVLAFARCNNTPHYRKLLENPQIQAHLQTYDRFILLSPQRVPYIQDDVRIEDETFRDKLHHTFIELFDDLDIRFKLVEGPTLERVSTILDAIQDAYWQRPATEAELAGFDREKVARFERLRARGVDINATYPWMQESETAAC